MAAIIEVNNSNSIVTVTSGKERDVRKGFIALDDGPSKIRYYPDGRLYLSYLCSEYSHPLFGELQT